MVDKQLAATDWLDPGPRQFFHKNNKRIKFGYSSPIFLHYSDVF